MNAPTGPDSSNNNDLINKIEGVADVTPLPTAAAVKDVISPDGTCETPALRTGSFNVATTTAQASSRQRIAAVLTMLLAAGAAHEVNTQRTPAPRAVAGDNGGDAGANSSDEQSPNVNTPCETYEITEGGREIFDGHCYATPSGIDGIIILKGHLEINTGLGTPEQQEKLDDKGVMVLSTSIKQDQGGAMRVEAFPDGRGTEAKVQGTIPILVKNAPGTTSTMQIIPHPEEAGKQQVRVIVQNGLTTVVRPGLSDEVIEANTGHSKSKIFDLEPEVINRQDCDGQNSIGRTENGQMPGALITIGALGMAALVRNSRRKVIQKS